jgi:HEAT repeat protein
VNFILLLALTLARQDPPPPPVPEPAEKTQTPTPAEAAAAITLALKDKAASPAQAQLKAHGKIADPAVVKAVADGLKHGETVVRLAALEALRFNADPSATEELLKLKSNKKLLEDVNAAEAYALALGQKRDKRALPILKDGLVASSNTNGKVMQAKIRALGRIREKESCEIIMDFMSSAVVMADRYMAEIRVSMAVLTGADQGPAQRDWRNWWNDNKSKLKILAEEAPLPAGAQRAWTILWMSPEEIAAARNAASGASGKGDS